MEETRPWSARQTLGAYIEGVSPTASKDRRANAATVLADLRLELQAVGYEVLDSPEPERLEFTIGGSLYGPSILVIAQPDGVTVTWMNDWNGQERVPDNARHRSVELVWRRDLRRFVGSALVRAPDGYLDPEPAIDTVARAIIAVAAWRERG